MLTVIQARDAAITHARVLSVMFIFMGVNIYAIVMAIHHGRTPIIGILGLSVACVVIVVESGSILSALLQHRELLAQRPNLITHESI